MDVVRSEWTKVTGVSGIWALGGICHAGDESCRIELLLFLPGGGKTGGEGTLKPPEERVLQF